MLLPTGQFKTLHHLSIPHRLIRSEPQQGVSYQTVRPCPARLATLPRFEGQLHLEGDHRRSGETGSQRPRRVSL